MSEQLLTGLYNNPFAPPQVYVSAMQAQPFPATSASPIWSHEPATREFAQPMLVSQPAWPLSPEPSMVAGSSAAIPLPSFRQSFLQRPDVRKRDQGSEARIASIVEISRDVWGNSGKSIRFLLKAHPALNGQAPISAASTEAGAAKVKWLLGAIMHGLPA